MLQIIRIQCHTITRIQCHPITRIQCHPIARIQCHIITTIQCHTITRIQCHTITRIQCHLITIMQYNKMQYSTIKTSYTTSPAIQCNIITHNKIHVCQKRRSSIIVWWRIFPASEALSLRSRQSFTTTCFFLQLCNCSYLQVFRITVVRCQSHVF